MHPSPITKYLVIKVKRKMTFNSSSLKTSSSTLWKGKRCFPQLNALKLQIWMHLWWFTKLNKYCKGEMFFCCMLYHWKIPLCKGKIIGWTWGWVRGGWVFSRWLITHEVYWFWNFVILSISKPIIAFQSSFSSYVSCAHFDVLGLEIKNVFQTKEAYCYVFFGWQFYEEAKIYQGSLIALNYSSFVICTYWHCDNPSLVMIKGFYFPLMYILMFHDYLTKHKKSNGSPVLGWHVL